MNKTSQYASRRQIVAGICLISLDCLFFSLTNPNKVPSWVLIVGFVLVALSLYGLIRLITAVAVFYGLPLKNRGKRISMLLGVSGGIAVALQSLGELTLRDVVVLTLLSGLAYVYMSYGRGQKLSR